MGISLFLNLITVKWEQQKQNFQFLMLVHNDLYSFEVIHEAIKSFPKPFRAQNVQNVSEALGRKQLCDQPAAVAAI